MNTSDILDFEKVCLIQVLIDNDFNEQNESSIIFGINESNGNYNYVWDKRYLIVYSEKKLDEWQTGLFNYEFRPITDKKDKKITIDLSSGNQNVSLKNIRIKFLAHN
jgi:hypothetical protein